ncbi:MAG: sulfite exporter TauE/SafE family protein [Verrucomicrobiales bacterium]|nr:sulfite exporter TauE/SafE family protein [Verrucomicrobiales bacterium]
MIAVLTGLLAGFIHVWTGTDHLSAVAPLAVRQPRRAWIHGVRWGFGHSTGVAVVGLLSLWLRDLIPVEWLSSWGERLVGVMLFGIGLWALHQAFKNKIHTHQHEHDGDRHIHIHTHHHGHAPETASRHRHTHVAFGIGTLHGLAGSSHFLGVLPALAFPTGALATAYLLAFGLGTVAAMALFSWGLGRMTVRFAGRGQLIYRGLMTTCGVAALGVGVFWLATSFR